MASPQASAAALPQLKAATSAQSLIGSGSSAQSTALVIQLGLEKRQATEVTTTSDISEIKEKLQLRYDERCDREGDIVSCRDLARFGLGAGQTVFAFSYGPSAGLALPSGVVGTVRTTVEVKGYAPAEVQTEIIAVDKVGAQFVERPTLTAKPGETVTARFGFEVSGTLPARGVVIDFMDGPQGDLVDPGSGLWRVEAVDRFSNCSYNGVELLRCRFDQEFAPGRTYVVPIRAKVRADVGKRVELHANIQSSAVRLPEIEAVRSVAPEDLGTPGGGPKLVVDHATAVDGPALQLFTASAGQDIRTDSKLDSEYEKVKLYATTVYYQKMGDVVPFEVGFDNGGEALHRKPYVIVTLPFNAKPVVIPPSCYALFRGMDYALPVLTDPAPVGSSEYICAWRGTVGNGQRLTLAFSLRMDAEVTGAGRVSRYPYDFSGASDVTFNVVKGTPPSPSPSPSVSATPSPGPSGSPPVTATPTPSGSASAPPAESPSPPASGNGGGLPLTGLPLVTFGAVGVGMLVVGFILLVYGRRSRVTTRSE